MDNLLDFIETDKHFAGERLLTVNGESILSGFKSNMKIVFSSKPGTMFLISIGASELSDFISNFKTV